MAINTRIKDNPLVGIVGGSTSDFPILKKSVELLDHLEVESELKVVSAHRTPDWLFEYAEKAEDRGLKVIIAGAGGAAPASTSTRLLAKHRRTRRKSPCSLPPPAAAARWRSALLCRCFCSLL